MTINNLKELREVGHLSLGDIIIFGNTTFKVCYDHLYSCCGKHEDVTKELFGNRDKEKFCSDAYGYESDKGSTFPEFVSGDFKAAYRVAEKIYIEILGQGPQAKFQKGDKVRIRSWESMVEEFGVMREMGFGDIIYFISAGSHAFTSKMKHLCGRHVTIARIHSDGQVDLEPIGGYDNFHGYRFNTNMIEPVENGYSRDPEAKRATEKKLLTQLVKEAEKSSGKRLISDYDDLCRTDICGTAFSFPHSSSCASIAQDAPDECCPTAEKKRRKRFKIQDFFNDRDRK